MPKVVSLQLKNQTGLIEFNCGKPKFDPQEQQHVGTAASGRRTGEDLEKTTVKISLDLSIHTARGDDVPNDFTRFCNFRKLVNGRLGWFLLQFLRESQYMYGVIEGASMYVPYSSPTAGFEAAATVGSYLFSGSISQRYKITYIDTANNYMRLEKMPSYFGKTFDDSDTLSCYGATSENCQVDIDSDWYPVCFDEIDPIKIFLNRRGVIPVDLSVAIGECL
jgi:hypothetical protein